MVGEIQELTSDTGLSCPLPYHNYITTATRDRGTLPPHPWQTGTLQFLYPKVSPHLKARAKMFTLSLKCCSTQKFVNICQVLWDLQRENTVEMPRLGLICCIYLSSCTWDVGNSCRDWSKSPHSFDKLHGINPLHLGSSIWYESCTWPEAFTLVESKTLNRSTRSEWIVYHLSQAYS